MARELVQIQEAGRRIFVHFLKSVSWFSSAECICMRYTIIIPNTAGHVNDGECGWRGEGAVIGLIIGLKHELCASVKVSADQL